MKTTNLSVVLQHIIQHSGTWTPAEIQQIQHWCQSESISQQNMPSDAITCKMTLRQASNHPDDTLTLCHTFLQQQKKYPKIICNSILPHAKSYIQDIDDYYDNLAAAWEEEQAWQQQMRFGPCHDEAWQLGYQI